RSPVRAVVCGTEQNCCQFLFGAGRSSPPSRSRGGSIFIGRYSARYRAESNTGQLVASVGDEGSKPFAQPRLSPPRSPADNPRRTIANGPAVSLAWLT